MELFKAIYIAVICLGLLTCIGLGLAPRVQRGTRILIAFYIILLLSSPLNAYIALLTGEVFAAINFVSQSLTWSYAPLLYLILSASLLENLSLRKVAPHFIPFLFIFALRINGYIQTVSLKLYMLLLFIQIAIYLVFVFRKLWQKKSTLISLYRGHKYCGHYWLLYLGYGLPILIIFDGVVLTRYILQLNNNLEIVALIASGVASYLCGICFLILYQPNFLVSLAPTGKLESLSKPAEVSSGRNFELLPETANELITKLNNLVDKQKLYLDVDLSLPTLATALGVSRSQLSELFNVHMQTTFYDYLNDLRFQESVRLLRNPYLNLSVGDIAYQAGFNNRNSFHRVFKQKTGQTPSEYKRLPATQDN